MFRYANSTQHKAYCPQTQLSYMTPDSEYHLKFLSVCLFLPTWWHAMQYASKATCVSQRQDGLGILNGQRAEPLWRIIMAIDYVAEDFLSRFEFIAKGQGSYSRNLSKTLGPVTYFPKRQSLLSYRHDNDTDAIIWLLLNF